MRESWRVLRPLGYRDFRVLFGAVVLSIFAAGMWAVVMVYSVIGAGGGPLDLSVVAAANATGLLLCAIPGGIVADRVSRRLIVRLVELVNLLAITSVVVVGWFGVVTIPQLAIVAFALGAGAGFFFPAYSAMLPRILPPQQLLAANGLEGAIRPALQQAAGPAVAGVIVAAVMVPTHAAVAIAIAHALALALLLFQGPEPVLDRAGAVGVGEERVPRPEGGRRLHGEDAVAAVDAAVRQRLGARLRRTRGGAAALHHPRPHRRRPALVRVPPRGVRPRRGHRLDRGLVAAAAAPLPHRR